MLLISMSIDLRKRIFNSSLLLFPSFFQFPPLDPNMFFCFSNHQGPLLFFYLLILLQSSALQCHHKEGNLFLEYDQSNWLFGVGHYLCVLFSPIHSRIFFISYFLWPFYLLHSPLTPHFKVLQIFPFQFSLWPCIWAM
jgi:hypothetical protein